MPNQETHLPRPLDRGEAFFWLLDRVSANNFVVIAEGEGSLPEDALKAALARAQREHPLLTACITAHDDGQLYFEQGTENPIQLTIAASESDWRTQLARFMVQPFALGETPLMRACRIDQTSPDSSYASGEVRESLRDFQVKASRWVFALVFHHSIADGRSASQLLLEILEHASGVERVHRTRPIQPQMHAVFPPPLHGQAGEDHAGELKQAKRLEFKALGKPDEFPAFVRTFGPTDPGLVSFHVSAEQLTKIAERARQEKSSVNGAVGAAQLLAIQAAFSDGRKKLLSQVHATDLRDTLIHPIDHSTPGSYVSMVTSTQLVDGPASFWTVARGLTQDIRRQLQRGDGHQFFRLLPPPESFPPTPEGIAAFAEMIGKWPLSNMLSNVGRLPELHKSTKISLQHVSFALCPNPSVVVFCTASTYQGRLSVNINYEKHRLAEPVLRQIAAVFEEQLLNCARSG